MIRLGASWVHDIDASTAAISAANQRSTSAGFEAKTKFEVADIYNLNSILEGLEVDCTML